ncbi:hypothetical protein [Rhodococcus sp. JVH1]|uniref:hypothetical protein n=1 Tax=Rhodococcus sp. JVH1 TaxID=745408 RepID=UPI000271F96B|nr:hypothetical protein [Rhodococcus sp. JVH1]EJI96158.1 putative membrane protein [Rhodococcus sp. JVH1]
MALLAEIVVDTEGDSRVVVLFPMMWLFFAVLVTFVVTRTITRRIRSRSGAAPTDDGAESGGGLINDITVGGVHLHHQVFGILFMTLAGLALIATTPEGTALNVFAALFGVGLALTFDEFALWVHLDDVYWSTSGRKSVDAIFCALMITGLMIGGAELVTGRIGTPEWWSSIGYLAISLAISVICMLKGKFVTGIVGIVFQPVAIIGAIRLAKPDSWWAMRRYPNKPRRMARARSRFGERYHARWNRARDFVAGPPDVREAGMP